MTLHYACALVIDVDDLVDCDCKLSQVTPPLTTPEVTAVLESACDALARITHLPIGRCSTVYRPCIERCHWWGCPCGCHPSGIPLPGILPVVTAVNIDGVNVLAPNIWSTVIGPLGPTLERIDGHRWPVGQNTAYPVGGANTFSITVESGLYPDEIMKAAAAEIACDILTRLASEQRKPVEGVSSASGYGITQSYQRFSDPTDQATMNLAGLGWVRRFVASVGGLNQSAIMSNDMLNGWKLYETV